MTQRIDFNAEFPVVSSKRAYDSGIACAVCWLLLLAILLAGMLR